MPAEKLRTMENRHRRRLLVELLDDAQENALKFPEDVPVSGTEREAFRAEMYHQHLPRLEDRGYIRWDRDAREIAKGPMFEDIGPLLELIRDHQDELPERWF